MARKKTTSTEAQSQTGRLGEFGSAIMQIAEEKGIPKEKVIETIGSALAAAYKKDYGKRGQYIRSEFNEVDGSMKFFKIMEVVDETTREFYNYDKNKEEKKEEGAGSDSEKKNKKGKRFVEKKENAAKNQGKSVEEEKKIPRFNSERDILFVEAKKINKGVKVGDILEIKLESKSDYGRIAAQTAKQVIVQKIREAERDSMFNEYKKKENQVINGIIQRIEGRTVYVDLGKSIGALFSSEQIEGEKYRIGQRIRVYLSKVESDSRGPGISLSRKHPEMVRKLFELEVPEVFAGTVEIKSIAREAGLRTKVAVFSKEEGLDPIGSCVGQKGTRVQSVIEELGGEKIDIILWNKNPKKFISASLSPAKVLDVEINEETREARVKVPQEQLSLAIGRQGQNVRLAAKLTGWRIDIIGDYIPEEKISEEEIETENPEKTDEEKVKQ